MKCAKCNNDCEGYKCAICGVEDQNHDDQHTHGEPASSRYCMPKCKACGQADAVCSC